MMQRYVRRTGVTGLLVLAGSAAGQTTFNGNDSGIPFSFTGISPSSGAAGGAGISDGEVNGQNDAFDGAFSVDVNGVRLSGSEFFVALDEKLRDLTVSLDAETSATYTLAFSDFRPWVRLDVVLKNRGTAPRSFNVELRNNYGSDTNTQVIDTSSGDGLLSVLDRWVVTDESFNQTGGDPAIGFVFAGPNAEVIPTSATFPTAGFVEIVYDVTIDPFDDRTLSFFIEIQPTSTSALGRISDFNTKSDILFSGAYSANFSGRLGREINVDTALVWDGSDSNSLIDRFNWELNTIPAADSARIRNAPNAFLPAGELFRPAALDVQNTTIVVQQDAEIDVTGRFKIDEDSTIVIDGGTVDPQWPILSDGTIRVESPGAIIGPEGSAFPSLRNSGLVEIVGTPFSPAFASLDIDDDALNLDQWILRGAATLRVDELENQANLDIVFANAVLNGDLRNTPTGFATISGASQFNQVGNLTNDGKFVISGDSSYSLLGALTGNGIEGPGGPGTAGTVFIRDGVSGRADGTGVISFDGPLSIGSNAATVIRLGGISAGIDHDQLVVADTFNAAGAIRFESVNGFVPQPGDVFDVLDFGAIQGSFAVIDFDATLAGVGIDTADLLVNGTIRVPGNDCPADTNGDGVLSPADFNGWIIAFNSQSPACDQNGDGLCTPADFNGWILNFNAGCP